MDINMRESSTMFCLLWFLTNKKNQYTILWTWTFISFFFSKQSLNTYFLLPFITILGSFFFTTKKFHISYSWPFCWQKKLIAFNCFPTKSLFYTTFTKQKLTNHELDLPFLIFKVILQFRSNPSKGTGASEK